VLRSQVARAPAGGDRRDPPKADRLRGLIARTVTPNLPNIQHPACVYARSGRRSIGGLKVDPIRQIKNKPPSESRAELTAP